MKKTFALILTCCLLTGCSFNSGISDFGESIGNSYISSQSSAENYSEPSTANESVSSGASDEPTGVPASSPDEQSSVPSLSSVTSSKPQSSTPAFSSVTSSKPQSSTPASSSSVTSSKPQSSTPVSSSVTSSKPQSSTPASSSVTPSKPQSSSSVSEPVVPEIIGSYGMRAQEPWEVEFSNEVFRLTNIERVKNGLPEFKRLPLLDETANIRAWEVLIKYGHDRPDGRSCFTAYKEAGISYSAAAENIAAGYPTPEDVVDGWMNSPRHCANILNPDLEYLGVGFYYDKDKISGDNYRYYWSQNFCTTW